MARRQQVWASRALFRLRIALGAACAHCGAIEKLQFDCIQPQGHDHHAVGQVGRATFYRKQARAGNLQLLCQRCHSAKTLEDLGYYSEYLSDSTLLLCPVNSVNNSLSPYDQTNNTEKDGEQNCEPF